MSVSFFSLALSVLFERFERISALLSALNFSLAWPRAVLDFDVPMSSLRVLTGGGNIVCHNATLERAAIRSVARIQIRKQAQLHTRILIKI